MPLTQSMRDLLAKFTTTEDSTSERFGSTGAWVHVGSSTAAFSSTMNSLQSTGVVMKALDSGYPKRNDGTESTAANILAYRATYTTSEAVFDWNEFGMKNSSSTATGTGTLFQRLLSTEGSKPNTQTWQPTIKITLTT